MDRDPNIRDYISVVVKWRGIVLFNVITITLLAVVVSLVLPKKYTSTGRLLPPLLSGETMGISNITSMLSGGGLPLGMGATPSDLFAALLKSRTVLDSIIEEYKLKDYYRKKTMAETRKRLLKITKVEVSPEGIIAISVTDKDPNMASRIATSYIRYLDRLNRETSMTVGKRNRIFLEERLNKVEQELSTTEDSLRAFQERCHILSLPDELKEAVSVMSTLLARKISKEIELGMARMYALEENPEVVTIKKELSLIEKQIKDIGYEPDLEKFGVGFSVPLQDVPETSLKLARLTRDVEVKQKVFAVLTEQYEQAKLQEVRDTPTVELLDRPEPPEKRSFPKRTRIVIVAFVLSLFVGVGLAFFSEYTDNIKDKEEGRRWAKIGEELKRGLFRK
jgi:uncharacterized protein involved in exopolysaccharide biosynthesis